MIEVLVFSGRIDFAELKGKSEKQLYALAKHYENEGNGKAEVVEYKHFQDMFNEGKIKSGESYIFIMNTRLSEVSVVGYNSEKFREDYKDLIVEEYEDVYGTLRTIIRAPQETLDEIHALIEEGVEVESIED